MKVRAKSELDYNDGSYTMNHLNNKPKLTLLEIDSKKTFYRSGTRMFSVNPTPRKRMQDIPLHKSKLNLTSSDVLGQLREEKF